MKIETDKVILSNEEWYAILGKINSPWEDLRREAAAHALAGFIAADDTPLMHGAKEKHCKMAIEWADELIKQLREDEK